MKKVRQRRACLQSMASMAVVLFFTLARPCSAWVEPAESLADPALEDRARAISRQLRCMVCQNQSIEESNTELASDMRRFVREQVISGATDEDIIRFLADRYGDFVTLMPPFKPSTWLLWFAPVVFLLIAGWTVRRSLLQGDKDSPLSDEEKRHVQLLMQEEKHHG